MIRHQEAHPGEPPIFRFGILISASLPWISDEDKGIDVTPLIVRGRPVPVDIIELNKALASVQDDHHHDPSNWVKGDGISPALRKEIAELAKLPFIMEDYTTRRMHPDRDLVRLQIPTAHILGKTDWAYEGGKKLRELCDLDYVESWEHAGGHTIPRFGVDVMKVKQVIEKTVSRSEFR
jgi:serine hydrolase FSH1